MKLVYVLCPFLLICNLFYFSAKGQIDKNDLRAIYRKVTFYDQNIEDTSPVLIENNLISVFIQKNDLCTFDRIKQYSSIDSVSFEELKKNYSIRGKKWIFKLFDFPNVKVVNHKTANYLRHEVNMVSYKDRNGITVTEELNKAKSLILRFSFPVFYKDECFVYSSYGIGAAGGMRLFLLRKTNGHWYLVKELNCSMA